MFIVLFSSIPVPGVVTLEPNAAWMVCVVETTLPSPSATVRWVVSAPSPTYAEGLP